jgi:hypothetical protein
MWAYGCQPSHDEPERRGYAQDDADRSEPGVMAAVMYRRQLPHFPLQISQIAGSPDND